MNRIMWLTAALGIIGFSQAASVKITWRWAPLRFVDINVKDQDFYFDRVVILSFQGGNRSRNFGIGVHISSDRILTSFNPYRTLIRNETWFKQLLAVSLYGRTRNADLTWGYHNTQNHLACGRQIQDLPDQVITEGDLWHGQDNRNCPLHDLLVFRIYNDLEVSTVKTTDWDWKLFPDNKKTSIMPGVFLTRLAVPDEHMGANFKVCDLVERRLKVTKYTEDDRALLDCDEWLPRAWGYFFCIRNKNEKYTRVTSGAMLVSNERLFGVGSFALTRGEQSIIVFTDVRPYYHLIRNTCTYADSEEKRPENFEKTPS